MNPIEYIEMAKEYSVYLVIGLLIGATIGSILQYCYKRYKNG